MTDRATEASAEQAAWLAGWHDDAARIEVDMAAIRARLDRMPTPLTWMVLAVAYVTFIAVAFGLL